MIVTIDNLLNELAEEFLVGNSRIISIEDFIRKRANHWRHVDAWRKVFEKMLANRKPTDITFERTSEIFITKGTKIGERRLRYFPIYTGSFISHIILRERR